MNPTEALLESWRREADIVNRLASLVSSERLHLAPAPGEWTIGFHLCHIHETRYFWLSKVAPEHAKRLGDVFFKQGEEWVHERDVNKIREQLELSGRVVAEATKELIEKGTQAVGGYDHPVLFLQHMLWHDGWHVGILMVALRQHNLAPTEEWEEANVWGQWRVEE